MSITIPGSLTGAPQTSFSSPVYTTVADNAPDFNAKQNAITAADGTQAGVLAHSVSSPFLMSVWKPKVMQSLGKPNPTTGLIANVPNNQYKVITLKGVTPQAGQPFKNMIIKTTIDVPAGSDTADLPNLKAGLSAHIGLLWDQSAGIGDSAGNGLI